MKSQVFDLVHQLLLTYCTCGNTFVLISVRVLVVTLDKLWELGAHPQASLICGRRQEHVPRFSQSTLRRPDLINWR